MPTHSRIQSRRPTQTAGGNANASTQTGGHIALGRLQSIQRVEPAALGEKPAGRANSECVRRR